MSSQGILWEGVQVVCSYTTRRKIKPTTTDMAGRWEKLLDLHVAAPTTTRNEENKSVGTGFQLREQ
jgi:hypothetical protein